MPTTRKKEIVKDLHDLLANSQVLVFTDYRGLTVSEISNLRRQLREKGVEYHVTKNTLTTLAASRAGLENLSEMLDGPTAIAFVADDIPGAAKVLADFAKASKVLTIRGGLMGKTLLNADQVSDLTKILSREQYIAKLMGSMQSPITGFVTVLSGPIRSFMNVMQARIDQLKEQGDTGEAPVAEASVTAEAPAATETQAAASEAPTEAPATAESPESAETTEATEPTEATEATEETETTETTETTESAPE